MKLLQKKIMLFATTAVMAAAFAVPATASAAEWTREGEPLTENAEATFTGVLNFSGLYGSFGCMTTLSTTLEPGGTGTLDSFEPEFSFCNASGLIAPCFWGSVLNPGGTPWPFNPESPSEIGLSEIELTSSFGGPLCPFTQPLVFKGSLTAFPDSSSEIASIEFSKASGTLNWTYMGTPLTTTASGTLSASFTPEGNYGVE